MGGYAVAELVAVLMRWRRAWAVWSRSWRRLAYELTGQGVAGMSMACRALGTANLHPVDAVLKLPPIPYFWQVRQAVVMRALAGSYERAQALLRAAIRVSIVKRQLEQIVDEADRDAAGFYLARQVVQAPPGLPLGISADGNGVATQPRARRAMTARKHAREFDSDKRLGIGEKAGHKRISGTSAVLGQAERRDPISYPMSTSVDINRP